MPLSQDILFRIIRIHVPEEEPEPLEEWIMFCKTGPMGPNGELDDIVSVEQGTLDPPLAKCGFELGALGVTPGSPIDPMTKVLWYVGGVTPQIREVWIRFTAINPVDPRQDYPPLKPPDAGIPG